MRNLPYAAFNLPRLCRINRPNKSQRTYRLHHIAQAIAIGCVLTQAVHADEKPTKAPPAAASRDKPLSPDESSAQLQIADGYRFQLIASEPEVASPVDAAFDDRGRLWVVEMIDYPYPKPDQQEPRGRIRILSDKNQDGRFDAAAVFADKLVMPTGIGLWRDGAVVTLGGKLVFMRDTDGDDKSDKEEVWLEGFAEQNEQLRANHPRLELDGRWYIASGLRGGKIQVSRDLRGETPAEPFDLGSRDVRLDPRTGVAEAITGPAQFGLTSDPTGTRMFCSNRNPCVQVVFEQSLLADNPLAGIVPATIDVLAAGEASHVSPLVNAWTTSNLHAGQFTAACGVHFQHVPTRHDMPADLMKKLQRESSGIVYVCEPTGSLVHAEQVNHASSTWKAERTIPATDREQSQTQSGKSSEWLASRDPWFRPVNVVSAPGNGVLVIDMHRAVIEHPAWVPDELKKRPDERYGEDVGRIYWCASNMFQWPSKTMSDLAAQPLGKRSSDELIALLNSDDAWLARMAARLLIERNAIETLPALVQMVQPDSQASHEARVVAWQLIALFDPGASSLLVDRLTDTNRYTQIVALRLLGRTATPAPSGSDSSLTSAVRAALDLAVTTADAWLRLEAVMCAARTIDALPADEADKAAESLGKLAAANSDDPHLLVAVAGATRKRSSKFLLSWMDGLGQIAREDARSQVSDTARVRWLTTATRQLVNYQLKNDPQATSDLIASCRFLLTSEEPISEVARLVAITALTQRSRGLLSSKTKPDAAEILGQIDRPIWRKIRETARLDEHPLTIRLAAIETLGTSPRKVDKELLKTTASTSENAQIRLAALKAWAEQGSEEVDAFILEQLVSAGPSTRPALLDLVLARPARHALLLDALQAGKLTARQLGAVDLKRFVDRATGDTKKGLAAQLDTILNSDRASVLKNYQGCLDLSGDIDRGKQVFTKHCAACHRIGNVGVQVGPDISDSRVQTGDKLLTSILDPNRAIDNNYFRFIVLTSDGRTVDGLITEETADKLVIKGQNDQRYVVARADIEQLKATGVSMMPEGLESQIDQQAMADLIAFIKNWRYSDGQVPAGIKAGK